MTRGAAGRMASQFNNLIFLDHVLQFTDIMIMHHTGERPAPHTAHIQYYGRFNRRNHVDCSAELFSNADVCQTLIGRAPDASGIIGDLKLPGYDE